MSDSQDVSYLSADESAVTSKFPDPGEIASVYQACCAKLQRQLQITLDIVDDTLFDLASGSPSAGDQNHFFDAMRDVRLKRKSIQQEFLTSVTESFEPSKVFSSRPSAEDEKLSVVDSNNAEFQVALEAMETKASTQFKSELSAAQLGIAELYNAKVRSQVINPLDPKLLCKAFHRACGSLELNVRSYLLLLKIFDKQVMGNLDEVLGTLEKELNNQGIKIIILDADREDKATQQDNDQIVVSETLELSPPILTDRVRSNQTANSKSSQEIVGLVGQLFEFIYKDYQLARPIQGILSRLQIVYLEVIFADQKTFFASDKHPARVLLNSMAEAGKHWSPTEPLGDILLAKLENISKRAKHDFNGDITLFISLSRELSAFMMKLKQADSLEQKRQHLASAGSTETKESRRLVEKELDTLLNEQPSLPNVFTEFLRGEWKRVLIKSCLQRNSAPSVWSHQLELTNQLVWCAKIPETKDQRRVWVQVVPRLLKEIDNALIQSGIAVTASAETISTLKHTLTELFKLGPVERTRKSRRENEVPNNFERADSIELTIEQLQPYLKIVDALTIGQWAEFRLENGSVHRCRLNKYDEQSDRLIFVNRLGTKPIEKSRLEIAKDIEKKRVTFLEDGLVVDRALNEIMPSRDHSPQ